MEYITLNDNSFSLEPIYSGTEANLYHFDNYLYKIYFRNYTTSILQLINLGLRQKLVKNTTFPEAIIINNESLIGCKIKYFKDYVTFGNFDSKPLKQKLVILRNGLNNLQELTNNYIYPRDLNDEGIITNGTDVKIIDLDTYTTKIIDEEDKKTLNFVLVLYKKIILKLIYSDYDPILVHGHLDSYLESKNINKSIIKDILKENIDYETLYNFISYFEDDKTISQQLHK